MQIEHRCTNELSLLIQGTLKPYPLLVRYSLHNRLEPQAHTGCLLTEKELLASICSQITTLAMITEDKRACGESLKQVIKTFLHSKPSFSKLVQDLKEEV